MLTHAIKIEDSAEDKNGLHRTLTVRTTTAVWQREKEAENFAAFL